MSRNFIHIGIHCLYICIQYLFVNQNRNIPVLIYITYRNLLSCVVMHLNLFICLPIFSVSSLLFCVCKQTDDRWDTWQTKQIPYLSNADRTYTINKLDRLDFYYWKGNRIHKIGSVVNKRHTKDRSDGQGYKRQESLQVVSLEGKARQKGEVP